MNRKCFLYFAANIVAGERLPPPTIRIGGQVTTALYQFTMQSTDTDELYAAAGKLRADLTKVPGLVDVTSDLQLQNPQLNITINRDKAATLKVNAQQIENGLYDAYGPRWVSTIYAPTNQYRVMLDLLPEYQARTEAISLLYLKSDDGRLVPLNTLATVSQSTEVPRTFVSANSSPWTKE